MIACDTAEDVNAHCAHVSAIDVNALDLPSGKRCNAIIDTSVLNDLRCTGRRDRAAFSGVRCNGEAILFKDRLDRMIILTLLKV